MQMMSEAFLVESTLLNMYYRRAPLAGELRMRRIGLGVSAWSGGKNEGWKSMQ